MRRGLRHRSPKAAPHLPAAPRRGRSSPLICSGRAAGRWLGCGAGARWRPRLGLLLARRLAQHRLEIIVIFEARGRALHPDHLGQGSLIWLRLTSQARPSWLNSPVRHSLSSSPANLAWCSGAGRSGGGPEQVDVVQRQAPALAELAQHGLELGHVAACCTASTSKASPQQGQVISGRSCLASHRGRQIALRTRTSKNPWRPWALMGLTTESHLQTASRKGHENRARDAR